MHDGEPDLRHHGDVDAAPGLLDFAVNVQGSGPPDWLRDRLAAVLHDLGRYPSAAHDARAREAVAARHGRPPDEVLLLAGSAEGFALLPALRPRLAAVLHPGFTEPEAALRAAGVPVQRVLTDAADGHRLRPDAVPAEADLVVVGNPTNPTGVLHPADAVRALCAPGRVVLVDEAFADAVPGEPESVAGDRARRAAGVPQPDQDLGAGRAARRLRARRPGAAGPAGRRRGRRGRCRRRRSRRCWPAASPPRSPRPTGRRSGSPSGGRHQAAALAAVPGIAVLPGRAPYLLLRLPAGQGERVRAALRDAGIAVRRGDTFPGLGPDHIRVAVRAPGPGRAAGRGPVRRARRGRRRCRRPGPLVTH